MEYKLKEIGTIITGITPKTKNEEYYLKKDYLFIGPTDIKNYKYVRKSEKYISNEAYKDYKKKFISKNSIMVDCIGSDMGNVAISVNDVLTNQQINSITNIDEKSFNVEYIYYVLSTMKKYFHQIGTNGSTMPIINKNMFEDIVIDIPNKKTQDAIANILSKLDQKIELNNNINDNLLEFVENIYDEKIIKNDNATLIKMSGLVEKTIGGDWGKEELTGNYNSKVLCIRGADIPELDSGNRGKAPTRFILEKNLNNKQLHGEEIIIEISGGSPTQSTGRCTYITKELEKAFDKSLICTNFCRAIKLKDNKYLPTFYMNLKHLYKKNIMFLYENGTTGIKNLDLTSLLDNEKIKIVDDEILNEFNELYYITNKKIIQNASENRILEELRDTLLPKIMNGEIDLEKLEV